MSYQITELVSQIINGLQTYLEKNQIPFVLFVSTEPVGNKGYMNWEQIKEIERSELGVIGHHSHSHDYLIDKSEEIFLDDIKSSNQIFKEYTVRLNFTKL